MERGQSEQKQDYMVVYFQIRLNIFIMVIPDSRFIALSMSRIRADQSIWRKDGLLFERNFIMNFNPELHPYQFHIDILRNAWVRAENTHIEGFPSEYRSS